ncbi:hypothetical protein [Polyangium mundeleinium]|uniref:DUF1566 domain-containing protein n=1 Tax=Polyangium mundeleinium TaxID=2995306 RepID=A0ABT5EPF4_9BACT|nr:hypothetical protein [Polyangium mundeleinium]MDC0743720.1 hypothetical protein [Polyangium mundeleinium]
MPVGLFAGCGIFALAGSTCLIMMAARTQGSDPEEKLKAAVEEFKDEKGEARSNRPDGRSFLADAAPQGEPLDSKSAQKRGSEDAGADGASSHAAIDEMAEDRDPTWFSGTLLWTRVPLKEPRTGKPAKYATLELAEAACAQRPTGWRLPSVREFRWFTKDGRINEMLFPEYPTGVFWATPDDRVSISASGVFDSYDGPASPMVLCVKEHSLEEP